MLVFAKRFLLFMNLIVNYGISPSTIIRDRRGLKLASPDGSSHGRDRSDA